MLKRWAPRPGERPGALGRLLCRLAGHPAGPLYDGLCEELRDLSCRACGQPVRKETDDAR